MMRVRVMLAALGLLALSACGSSADETAKPGTTTAVQTEQLTLGDRPKSFAQCAACHSVEPGQNGIGPTLAGVFDAEAGHIDDFAYSSAMRESGLTWDAATLDRYLENPRKTVPGTKMSYAGMRDAEKRAELIEYLKGL
jgi:cytochrome c